jgi:serine/threonine protein phosphatase 1
MRTLAIGDIHGCRTALETLIALVNPTPDDQLIFLGDYVNRGPDSRGVIGFLLKLAELRHCVFLRGNHEIMTMDARSDQSRASTMSPIGGRDLLRSYGFTGQSDWWNLIPPGHWQFFEHTARYFETDRHLFVHGSLDSDLDLAEQPDWIIFWERFETIRPHKSGKRIICGHTPSCDGQIQDVGYATCIDTAAVMGGWLTCLDVESGRYWQANEKGATRASQLPNWVP